MTMDAGIRGYYGRAKCGCIVMFTGDMLDHPKETAKDVAAAIRRGLTIERGTVEEIRKLPFGHKCGKVTDVKNAGKKKIPDGPELKGGATVLEALA